VRNDRPQTLGEEIANAVSHGVALVLGIVGVPVLIVTAVRRGNAASVVSAVVFAATIVLLYLASTLYHAFPYQRAKRVFKILDHSAIYLLIAGTYTPFTLVVLRGAWGWSLFGAVWGLAVLGVVLKSVGGLRYPILSPILYIAMGWIVIVAIEPLREKLPPAGLVWLLAGGIAYTGGVAFFAADRRVKYAHFVWHLFVIAGTTCHFIAVLLYAA
jgi:hemolysin III